MGYGLLPGTLVTVIGHEGSPFPFALALALELELLLIREWPSLASFLAFPDFLHPCADADGLIEEDVCGGGGGDGAGMGIETGGVVEDWGNSSG